MAICIGMKPSVVLDYLETCIGNHMNMKGAVLGIIIYACLKAFNVRCCYLVCFFTKGNNTAVGLWWYSKDLYFGPLINKICFMGYWLFCLGSRVSSS